MKINPFEQHPLTPAQQRRAASGLSADRIAICEAIDRAIFENFEARAGDPAAYVAVDNVLKILMHTIEDIANESR